jgi:ectoine hydroxylase-related dioxygenase (phytanoyl-CoA dioxygenase family)
MSVIPESHHDGIREHGKSDQAGNLLSINQEASVTQEDEKRAFDLILKAGEMSIHQGKIIHGSLPNRSTRRRCGLTIRYIPPWVKQIEENSMKRGWKAILLRGQDQEKNFGECPMPFSMN